MINYYVLRIRPVHRLEFKVLRAITQREHPCMVPFEEKWIQKPNGKWDQKTFPLYPCYVFIGMGDYREFPVLKASINEQFDAVGELPPILGLVGPNMQPGKLTDDEVETAKMRSTPGPTEVNIHKALQVGSPIDIVGSPWAGRSTTIDSFTKLGVKARLEIFNSWHIVEIPMKNVRAA